MKIIYTLVALLFTICVTAQSKEEKEVQAVVDRLRQALIDGNASVLSELTAEELSYGHSSGKIEDKKEFIQRLVSGASDFKSIQLSDQSIRIVGSTAIVRHKLVAETMDNGQPGNPNLSVLLIWQNQNGKWRLLARQATRLQN